MEVKLKKPWKPWKTLKKTHCPLNCFSHLMTISFSYYYIFSFTNCEFFLHSWNPFLLQPIDKNNCSSSWNGIIVQIVTKIIYFTHTLDTIIVLIALFVQNLMTGKERKMNEEKERKEEEKKEKEEEGRKERKTNKT